MRAAIAPLFSSALAEDVVPDLREMMASGSEEEHPEGEVKGDGVGGCWNWRKEISKRAETKACAKCLIGQVLYAGVLAGRLETL